LEALKPGGLEAIKLEKWKLRAFYGTQIHSDFYILSKEYQLTVYGTLYLAFAEFKCLKKLRS
jgi:hypothetical protein